LRGPLVDHVGGAPGRGSLAGILTRSRAVGNQAVLLAATLVGENRDLALAGNSLVLDPWGVPRTNAGRERGPITTEIDLAAVERVRERCPALADCPRELHYES
jgi:predicted amidohydrolase